MVSKKLDILIPTYNRSCYVRKNINSIIEIIEMKDLSYRVNILVSNDCSTDDTAFVLESYTGNNNVRFTNHETNIGVENNLLYLLESSSSDYVMYLGDDDYISAEYILSVINHIDEIEDLHAIVPSYKRIDIYGNDLPGGRDLGLGSLVYKKGFKSSKYYVWRAHQMSGIVLKREGVFDSYKDKRINNFYPHVYMILRATLMGTVVHETDYPILVTQPGQDKKGWSYGDDGLLNDYFDNFKSYKNIEKFTLEQTFLKYNTWRVSNSLKNSPRKFIKSVIASKNTTKATKLSYPFWIIKLLFSRLMSK
ncbi:TPA: glycosyltransferase [Vibrio parahaemolyticus]|nr:glycosyltransferase [Vibrio parahaemolyticus]